jgi:hypothetical protein
MMNGFREAPRLCRRAVLDTNCAAFASREVLRALHDHGWLLSVSSVALDERAARVAAGMPMDRFLAELRRLDAYLDPDLPVVIAGWEGLPAIGGKWRGRREMGREELRAYCRHLWRALQTGAFDREHLGALADETRREMDSLGAAWVRQHAGERATVQYILSPDEEARQVGGLARYIAREIELSMRVPGGVYQRLHGWCHYCALGTVHAVRAPKGGRPAPAPEENDTDDMHLLTHLYDSCFVMTGDYRFVAKVDESRTFQAAWVRTPGELLTDELPRGVPWSNAARREAHRFIRRRDLRDHDLAVVSKAKLP